MIKIRRDIVTRFTNQSNFNYVRNLSLTQIQYLNNKSNQDFFKQSNRYFSNKSFKDTLNKVNAKFDEHGNNKENNDKDKETETNKGNNEETQRVDPSEYVRKVTEFSRNSYSSFLDNIKIAWKEMTADNKESTLERKVHQAESYKRPSEKDDEDEDEDKEKVVKDRGPSAMVLVHEPKSPWESMKNRLQDSPLIRELLKGTRKVGNVAASTDVGKKAVKVGQSVQDKLHDAREFWETSQNPLVYTLAGVWENMTGETEEGITIAEIRKLDPNFILEEWCQEVKKNLAPLVIKSHLEGNTIKLKPWLGEGVYNKLAADIKMRKVDGIKFDSNILELEENNVVCRMPESGQATIVIVYMAQQINCIRNREGEIVEGSETDVRAKFYNVAFQQVYNDVEGVVQWKVVEYEFCGDIPYN